MTRKASRSTLFLAAAAAALCMTAGLLPAQQAPRPRGSLDALTVIPTTKPATQPASGALVLPPGHAPVGGTGGGSGAHPGGMGGAKSGALRVVFSKGTEGAPSLGKDDVRIELLVKGTVTKTIMSEINDKGIIEIRDLPLEPAFQPVVTVLHAGSEQQIVGPPMNKYQAAIELDMPVFETTAEKPAWTIGLRTVETEVTTVNGATVLRLTELVGGFNPTNRAWTGEGPDKRTLAVVLPAEARNVQFGPGLAEAGAKVVNGTIVRGKTMLPGSTQYVFAYDLPVKDGRAAATFTAPAETSLFAFYLPNGIKFENPRGLSPGSASGTHATENKQLLLAKGIKAGDVATVELTGIKAPPPAVKPSILDQTSDLNLPVPATRPKP